MNRSTLVSLATMIGSAGSAIAQLSYSNQSCDIVEATTIILGDSDFSSAPNQFGPTTMFGASGAFQANEQTFTAGGSYGPFAGVSSLNTNYSLTTRADSQGIRFSWSGVSAGSVATDQISSNDLVATDLTMRLGTIITVESAARLRFEFTASSSVAGLVETTDHILLSSVEAEYSNSLLFPDFRGGFNDDFSNPSFAFEIDAAAGSHFDFSFNLAMGIYTYGVGSGFDWNHFTNGSVSISVVPAPASAGLLGLAGLAAARRRRA